MGTLNYFVLSWWCVSSWWKRGMRWISGVPILYTIALWCIYPVHSYTQSHPDAYICMLKNTSSLTLTLIHTHTYMYSGSLSLFFSLSHILSLYSLSSIHTHLHTHSCTDIYAFSLWYKHTLSVMSLFTYPHNNFQGKGNLVKKIQIWQIIRSITLSCVSCVFQVSDYELREFFL